MNRTPPAAPPHSLDKVPEQGTRQTVRPAEAAVMLGIATPTLWRWTRDLPGFPQPERYRLAGRNVTVWYVDDLEAWMAKQGDMAWRRNAPAAAVPRLNWLCSITASVDQNALKPTASSPCAQAARRSAACWRHSATMELISAP